MIKRIGPIFLRVSTSFPPRVCTRLLNVFNALRGHQTRFFYANGQFTVRDELEINVGYSKRLPFYINGIERRLNGLMSQYMLEKIDFRSGDTVIDCGANIGEVGMALTRRIEGLRYIAFEPSNPEHRLCKENNNSHEVVQKALWRDSGTVKFYQKSETADSSIIPMSSDLTPVEVQATSLDDYASDNKLRKIKLLKLEAEGAEPEILEGAESCLPIIEFIAADLGPERGEDSANTFTPVVNALLARDFKIIGFHHKRSTILMKNSKL